MRSNQLFALGHGVKMVCDICGKTGVRQCYILRGLGQGCDSVYGMGFGWVA